MSDADNLEIKKRARRRLVGAAALALAAAIILPMMMEQEPAPGSPDIQVTIPDRDAPAGAARAAGNSGAPAADAGVAPAPVEEPPQPATTEAVRPQIATPPAVAAETAPKAPVTTPAPAKPAQSEDEAARVRALLEGKPATGNPAVAAGRESFVIQIGAFGDAGKAAAISSELKQAGFSAYTEKAGTVTRVRVGPFSSREDAEKAAAKLKAQGRNAVLTPR